MAARSNATERETPASGTVVAPLMPGAVQLPEILRDKIILSAWANSLVNRVEYMEPDPDYLSRLLITQTLTATSLEAVFEQNQIRGLQKAIPQVPDAGTGPIEIYDLYVTSSDLNEGAPCYMILSCTHLETGEQTKYTTGSQQLQAQVLAALGHGMWPIRCNIKRLDRKDKGGKFLFWMFPPE